jgi:hypothetical protein
VANVYREIARKVAIAVAQKAADFSAKFPSIVIQNTKPLPRETSAARVPATRCRPFEVDRLA